MYQEQQEQQQNSSTMMKATTATPTIANLPVSSTSSSSSLVPHQQQHHQQQNETEELLRDAFEELERERAQRLELEAQLKALQENSNSEQQQQKAREKKKRRSKSIAAAVAAVASDTTSVTITTTTSNSHSHSSNNNSNKHYTALQHELQGYRQIVDALTSEKPAIAAAFQAEEARRRTIRTGHHNKSAALHPPTLPLPVVRLLEIMPWDPQTQQHVFATEELYEWQLYSPKQQTWVSTLKQFPSFFQALPVLEATDNTVQESPSLTTTSMRHEGKPRSWLMFLAGCETMITANNNHLKTPTAPPSSDAAVLTNQGLTMLMNFKQGAFPLAQDGGTWKWIGGWRIEKRVLANSTSDPNTSNHYINNNNTSMMEDEDDPTVHARVLECDPEGWTYASDASDFLNPNAPDLCHDSPGEIQDRVTVEKVSFLTGGKVVERHAMPLRRMRRRKWSRRRVLVDYPYASEQTQAFLQLLAENAALTIAANNLSDQLAETKMKVTQAELSTQQTKEETLQQVQQLQQEIQKNKDMIAKLKKQQPTNNSSSSSIPSSPSSPSKGQVQHHADATKTLSTPETDHSVVVKSGKDNKGSNTNKNMEEDKLHGSEHSKKDVLQQGKELQSLLSHWVVSSTSKFKIIPNHHGDDASESPVPEDSSATSSTEIAEEDDTDEDELTVRHLVEEAIAAAEEKDDDGNHDDSISSNSSQKSFDWKKLGRETIEKLKEGPAKTKLPWLSPSAATDNGKDQSQQQQHDQEQQEPSTESKMATSSTSEVVVGA